ncbi:MAG TPA: aldo/keto reductase, partial [Anaerolineae bacterium]|nr:aldo/keto reductase [Anaerolineae bacterium]
MDAISATYEGTRSFAAQYPNLQYYPLGTTDFMVSQAGFGCYRINPRTHNHQLALRTALIHGINLIDTSTNYANGGSEQLVGHTLDLLFSGGQLKREQIVVVSKAGYLQGKNFRESQQRKQNGVGWDDLVEYAEGLEHCIHPDFIHAQLSHSMERLKLDCLDVYLLHNPEYYLGWARKHDVPLDVAREAYYERIRRAFIQLEQEVADGRIRSYGISSNSFPTEAENPEFTSLETIWSIAHSISPNHH